MENEKNILAKEMEAIVAEHQTALLRYAARIVNNPVIAQDVVQNVFIKLFKTWQKDMHASKKLKGWLFRVTHNEAVDHIRRESRIRLLHKNDAEEKNVKCPDGIHCKVTNADRKEAVLKYLKELKPREQQVVLLRMEQGLSYREISDVTGRSEGNVGNILHHAVRKLAGKMKRNVARTPDRGVK